jgi:hypothetical protein
LAKQHGNELTPTGETTGVTFGGMLLHRAFKIVAGKELEKLRENGAYSIQGGIPPERRLVSRKTQSKLAEIPPVF